ncbi:hypothetical protein ACFL2T_07055, partial [Elusimicrobiota bacterium]
MKILFAHPNVAGTYGDTYSLGLASIGSIARDKGFEIHFEVINTEDDLARFPALVDRLRPRIIAYTAVSSQFMFVKRLAATVRER